MTAPWPWPEDTQTDRARRIANSLLLELPEPQRDMWTARAHAVGETWLGSSMVRWTADDVVSTAEAAELVHVSPATIRKWHSAEGLRAVGRGRYRVGDVLDHAARKRRARAAGRST